MRVCDSKAYRKMDVTRERISRILELREILLSFQTGFNLVSAVVVRAVLESISGLEPSSVITEPRYLKLVTVSILCPFTLISVLMPHQLGLLGTDFHAVALKVMLTVKEYQLDCHMFCMADIAVVHVQAVL